MNATGRKVIAEVLQALEDLKGKVSDLKDEEQAKFDNMPDSLQQGEAGQKMEEVASGLEEVESSLDDATSRLEDVLNG